MRTQGAGFAFAFACVFSACSGETERDAADGGAAGAAGAAGTAGAALSGASGKGGSAGMTGSAASSGAAGTSTAGSPMAGTSGSSQLGGSSGAGTLGGASGTTNAGAAGALVEAGGTAGSGGNAGVSGTAGASQAGAGMANEAGSAGAGGESGEAGASGAANEPVGLSWPIDCIPNQTCLDIGYPDIDGDGDAHDCNPAGYVGHEGTDINISEAAQAAGTAVRAAADGVVVFAFDGKYDQCPDANEPDCQPPSSSAPGSSSGTTVCTPSGPYCGTGQPGCYWCFAGGNVIVIRHEGVPGVFATRYDHLRRNSVRVEPGDTVSRGQVIAEAASAGNSTRPHLHFEVWGTGFYELADPWSGPCGPNEGPSLWAYDPPWSL